MKFINDQYEKYLQEEVNINRKKRIPDTRVHCCLYFIPATGHSYVPSRGRVLGLGAEGPGGAVVSCHRGGSDPACDPVSPCPSVWV